MAEAGFSRDGEGRYRVAGPLTFETVGDLWTRSRDQLEQGKPVLIDLAAVTAVDSAGLSLLVEWARWARLHTSKASFEHVPAKLHALARIGELDELLGMTGP